MLTHLFTTYPSGSPSHYMLSHVHACLFTTCPSGSPHPTTACIVHVVTCTCMSIHCLSCICTCTPPILAHMHVQCISSLFTTGTCMYTVWPYQDSQPLPFLCALHVGTHACTCIIHVHACAFWVQAGLSLLALVLQCVCWYSYS